MYNPQIDIETDNVSNLNTDLYDAAKSLFSEGMVEYLTNNGLDIIEEQGEGVYIYDINGDQYFDCYSGNFILVSQEKATLANKLSKFVSGDLSCVLYTVVRGEAMDAACKLARGYTEKTGLITVDGGWYGNTGFAVGLSESEDKNQYGRLIPDQTIVEFNNIKAAEEAINHNTAAFILEPVQVENGCRMVNKEYLKEVKDLCQRHGTLLIFDETQTGFGRTGRKFIKDDYGVNPDILLFGEAITAGMFPMTGMMFTPAVKSFFDQHPLIHLCTFGGHDVGCRVACKTIEIYEEKKPWVQAKKLGAILFNHLISTQQTHPDLIRRVNGKGLVSAITFNP